MKLQRSIAFFSLLVLPILAGCRVSGSGTDGEKSGPDWNLSANLQVNPDAGTIRLGSYLRSSRMFVSPDGTPFVAWSAKADNRMRIQTIDVEKMTASRPVEPVKGEDIIVDHAAMKFDAKKNLAFLAVWHKGSGGGKSGVKHVYFTKSADKGLTWSAPAALNQDIGAFAPEMTYDGEGGIYVVWKDERAGLSDIFFNRSKDYGETWLPTDVRLSPGQPGNGVSASPHIISAPNGIVMVAFSHTPEGQYGSVYFRASQDYGDTWNEPLRVNDSLNSHMDFPQLARHPDGRLGMAWVYTGERNTSALYFDSSKDNGKTWGADRILYGSAPSAMEYLTIFSGGDEFLSLYWVDKVGNEIPVVYKSSDDFGANWSGGEKVEGHLNGPGGGNFRRSMDLRLAFDGKQTMAAVWAEYAHTAIVSASFSLDRGLTWLSAPVEINPPKEAAVSYRMPQIGLYKDSIYLTYQRWNKDESADVFFRKLTMKKWTADLPDKRKAASKSPAE